MNFLNIFEKENHRELFASITAYPPVTNIFLKGELTETKESKTFTHNGNTITVYPDHVDKAMVGETEGALWYGWEFEKDGASERFPEFVTLLLKI